MVHLHFGKSNYRFFHFKSVRCHSRSSNWFVVKPPCNSRLCGLAKCATININSSSCDTEWLVRNWVCPYHRRISLKMKKLNPVLPRNVDRLSFRQNWSWKCKRYLVWTRRITTRKLKSEWILGALSSKIKYLVEIVMWIGLEDVIWRSWTILFGERWKISVNQQSRNDIADKRSVTGKNSVDQMGYRNDKWIKVDQMGYLLQ